MYAVPISGGTPTGLIPGTITTYSSDTFDSLAVGPDNTADNATANNNFFLYACDSTTGTIIRLQMSVADPGNAATAVDFMGTVAGAVCGRVDSEGDLYVSSKTTGEGVYEISGASSTAVGSTNFSTPSAVFSSSTGSPFTGSGITQKNNGDMLVVDTAGNEILHATFEGAASSSSDAPFAPTLTSYVTGLGAPTAIARISTNDFFVLNQGSKKPNVANNVVEYNPADLSAGGTACMAASGGESLSSLATSEDNFVYVGVNSNGANGNEVDVLLGADCTDAAVQAITLPKGDSPLGLAVPPVPATTSAIPLGTTADGYTSTKYNFGSSVVEMLTDGCTPSVSQSQMPISYLQTLTDKANPDSGYTGTWDGGVPVPYDGEGGFATVYTVKSGCLPANVYNNFILGSLTDSTQFTNPRIIRCDGTLAAGTLVCHVTDDSGTWTLGGLVPDDITIGGTIPGFSRFFLVNGNLSGSSEAATFCGFESPLTYTLDPSQAATFSSGQNLSIKFKLGAAGTANSCSNGPYVTNAQALLSVARIADGNGNPVFEPIAIDSSGNSAANPPVFSYNANSQQYQFSLSLKGYASGTYAISITFLTNNAGFQTTLFKVVQ